MLGQLITLTTSIATTATVAAVRGGVAVAAGQGRRPAQRVVRHTIVETSRESVATLIAALDAEKDLRAQLERENARLREMVAAAQDVIDVLTDQPG